MSSILASYLCQLPQWVQLWWVFFVIYLSEFNFGELSLSVSSVSSTLAKSLCHLLQWVKLWRVIFVSYLTEFNFGELSLSVTSVSSTLVSYLGQLPQWVQLWWVTFVSYLSEFNFGVLSWSFNSVSSTFGECLWSVSSVSSISVSFYCEFPQWVQFRWVILVSYLSEFNIAELFLSVTAVSLTLVSYLC